MSIETRSSSALFKRAEQLKRWAQSDTNREPIQPKQTNRKIKFSSGCVFLAACASGDKEEVLRLLQMGADINTPNVDGLTALHQACIDDNLDMVEFLVEHGADVNRGDNEGWTPLHATASCGFKSIAKYLLEHGADVAAVNNDGELALDIAEEQTMEDLLQKEIQERGIDCDEARSEEERMMLRDAREWLSAGGDQVDNQHPKSGATALHIAAAKGYIKVLNILLQCKADIDKQDYDGWTAIHAAAHWGQRDAATILADNLADMDMKNYVGQTAFDVADSDMYRLLEDLKKRQNKEELLNKKQAKKRVETREPEIESPPKVKRVEVEIEGGETEKENVTTNSTVGEKDMSSLTSSSESESDSCSSDSEASSDNITDDEKKNRANSLTDSQRIQTQKEQNTLVNSVAKPTTPPAPTSPPKQINDANSDDNMPAWRRPGSFRTKLNSDNKNLHLRIDNKDKSPVSGTPPDEVTLRRTQSFQSDPKFYTRYLELRERIKASSDKYTRDSPLITSLPSLDVNTLSPINPPAHQQTRPLSHPAPILTQSLIDNSSQRLNSRVPTKDTPNTPEIETTVSTSTTTSTVSSVTTSGTNSPTKTTVSPATSPQPNSQVRSPAKTPPGTSTVANVTTSTVTTPNSPGAAVTRLSAGNIFKNFFKSFVPPVRDEESETQRKKHAKRVRETRRSTQGVTLDEIKSAAELNIKQNQTVNNNNNEQSGANGDSAANGAAVNVTATITTGTPTVPSHRDTDDPVPAHERRPSWRLRVDNGTSKFKLEDASKTGESNPSTVYVRRPGVANNTTTRPNSAPVEPASADATVTIALRRPKSQDDKEQDKENDARNAQATLATQAAIQRRRRPKRRSTGVVHVDMDEIDPDRQDTGAGGDYDESTKVNHQDSGSESRSSSRGSRLGSASDLSALRGENGELDYKKMYEQAVVENDRLREKLRKSEDDLRETKQTLEKINTVTSKNSLSELEKRERRAMERKLSEMEEELKQLQKLKAENERLRAENRALTRVVSKLTGNAAK